MGPRRKALPSRIERTVDMSLMVHYTVALYLSRCIPVYTSQCQAIVTKMATNSKWQGALLTQATAHIAALAAANQSTHKGAEDDTAVRNDALRLVKSDMRQLKAMVQGTADADMANAQSLIEGSGMGIVKQVHAPKPPIAAKHGKVPGVANLYAKAVKGALIYQWEMSSDAKSWSDLPWSKKSKTSV